MGRCLEWRLLRLTGAYVVVGAVGVFVGVKAKVIYLHLIETATIFFVLLPGGYTNICPYVEGLQIQSQCILVLLKALCSVSGDTDEGNFLLICEEGGDWEISLCGEEG